MINNVSSKKHAGHDSGFTNKISDWRQSLRHVVVQHHNNHVAARPEGTQ